MNGGAAGSATIDPQVLEAALQAWAEAATCRWLCVEGSSMRPLLQTGDLALVTPGRPGLRPGDILAFRLGDRLVIHRLLSCENGGLLLGGDNQPGAGERVRPQAVLGRVLAIRSNGRLRRLDGWQPRAVAAWLVATRRARGWRPAWRACSRLARALLWRWRA